MKSLLRFFMVLVAVFGTALLWKSDQRSIAGVPPKVTGKGNDPQEEIERSLRSLRLGPLQKDWSREDFQDRLADALRRNDPCSVLILLNEPTPVSPEEKWASGMEVVLQRQRENNPLLVELFTQKNSPLLGRPNDASRRLETRFFNALLYSNQLEGYDESSEAPHRNPYRDNEKAANLLKELMAEDPENGAYSFFLVHALRQTGASTDDAQAAYSTAAKAPRFDLFYQGIYDSLLQASYENLAAFAWVYTYLHGAPVPNVPNLLRNLRYWASQEDSGKWIAGRIAKKLIDTGSRYKSDSPGYLYSQTEYMQGYTLKFGIEDKAEQSWEEYAKRMKEARDSISETPSTVGLAEVDLYKDIFSGEKNDCRWNSWQALYEAYRAKKAN
jgi:hypothetical protein